MVIENVIDPKRLDDWCEDNQKNILGLLLLVG